MAYIGRDWDNTGTEVTKEDFKRMDAGIKANDEAITEQANQINVLYTKFLGDGIDLNTLITEQQGWVSNAVNSPFPNAEIRVKHINDYWILQEVTALELDGKPKKYNRFRMNNVWQDWQQIATTEQISVLNTRTLAPVLSNLIPDALYIGDEWTGICCVRSSEGTINMPPNCIIGIRYMRKLNEDNVAVYVDNTQNGDKWINTWNGSTWLGWQQIATTTKTSFLCTASSGYTIMSQNCYTKNDEFYINMRVKKTDGSAFNGELVVATKPFSTVSVDVGSAMGSVSSGSWTLPVNCFSVTGNSIVISTSQTTIQEIYLKIKGSV